MEGEGSGPVSALAIAAIVFACVFGSALLGMMLRPALRNALAHLGE